MKHEFAKWLEQTSLKRADLLFLTGDVGFNAFENLQNLMGERFINTGVAEQNMIGLAAALAQQGLLPFCYSIAPFLLYRPYEQIRLDICFNKFNVKLVGNGGGYGYGIMGVTHHAIEDLAIISTGLGMKSFIPYCNQDVSFIADEMMNYDGPSYLRLGLIDYPDYQTQQGPIVQIKTGADFTIAALGPMAIHALKALTSLSTELSTNFSADLFAIRHFPINAEESISLLKSVNSTKKLIVLEEHICQGGLGQNLCYLLLQAQIQCQLQHHFARGYPSQLYGSQSFHQKESGLDVESIRRSYLKFLS